MDDPRDLKTYLESINVSIGYKNYKIKLAGTIDTPYFCGKDICFILGYKDSKNVLHRYVDSKNKKSFKELRFSTNENPKSLGQFNHITHNEGQVTFISETGLNTLLEGSKNHKNKKELKIQVEKWLSNLRYGQNSGLMDIFSFIKGYNLTFDITSNWFQDLWYPLSKSQPPLQGG